MLLTYTIDPKSEFILQGEVVCRNNEQDGKMCMVNRILTCYELTGALVCRILAVPKQNVVPIRMINVQDTPFKVHKGTLLVLLELVVEMREVNPSKEKKECECSCMNKVKEKVNDEMHDIHL